MKLPEEIEAIVGGKAFSVDQVGLSGSKIICYEDMVLKIERRGEESDAEHRMMAWLSGRLPVPRVLFSRTEGETSYLLMSRTEGEMACARTYLDNPRRLVRLLAQGLRELWAVDISECPCRQTLDEKLRLAEIRVKNRLCDLEHVEPGTYGENGFASPAELLEWLKRNRPAEELVFSHGDCCLPNVFLRDNEISGFIDLGRSGIADRYQDIALCHRSLRDNLAGKFGGECRPGFDPCRLFDELQIKPDWEKIRYFILLDELF